jgi:carbon-monoxide dehydrogenase iron sulfur subunit
MRKKIVVDVSRCVGCRTCEVACAIAHSAIQTLKGAHAEGTPSRVLLVSGDGAPVPVQCRHCTDAPCVAVCPKAALTQDGAEGIVLPHPELCTACRSCVMVCPFGAVRLGGPEGKTLIKCDLCLARLEEGQEPACVEACPTGALLFLEPEGELAEAHAQAAAEVSGPSIIIEDETEAEKKPVPETDAEGKKKPARIACVMCGDEFAPPALAKAVAKKIGRRPAYLGVCPRCRRRDYAGALAQKAGAGATAKSE